MTDINLKTLTPDTSLPTTGFLFGADSQASTNPSVYSTQTVATTLLGSTSLTGDTLTADAPVLNLTQTWNNGAVTFTGIKYNAAGSSSTNSAAASLLMDLQVGGTSKFKVNKDGTIYVVSSAGIFPTYGSTNIGLGNTTSPDVAIGTGLPSGRGLFLSSTSLLGWSSVGGPANTADFFLSRKAAANIQLGAADAASPVAQTLSVQSIVAGQTNASAAAYPFTITGSQGTGSGAGGSIIFQVAPAGGSGSAQNALSTALTIDSVGIVDVTRGTVSGGLTFGQYGLLNAFGWTFANNNGFIGFAATGSGASPDVKLARDTAGTLAQRNGVNAQALNIYNTYTSSTSFERYSIDWITTANLAIVGPNKGSGGGTQRVQRLSYLEDGGAGSTVPLLGSTCPAASGTVKSWIKIITSDGTTAYIPCWA